MACLQSQTDCYDVIAGQGKGTFGEVMKAWKRSAGGLVAIKVLKNDLFRSRTIQNEIKLLKVIKEVDSDESHIIHFIEYFRDEVKFYLVFELLQQNLFEYQKKNDFSPIPVRHIRTIISQVLVALSKLKELSIIHADLKPENIMLVDHIKYPFRIKVIDFGSASIFSEVRYVKEPYIQSRFYRAPEILLGLPFCEKVDMWSLGCIIAELHLGCPLYPGNDEYDQIRYICETQGMPRNYLLNAASKSLFFFKRKVDTQAGTRWKIKTVKEHQLETKVEPLERRKFILKSLDHIQLMKVPKSHYPDMEVLAENYDLKNMVELIKRMLTWDSHERINPNAAMKHPFISLQHLKMIYEHTKYYQLSQQCHNDTMKREHSFNYNMQPESYPCPQSLNYYQGQVMKDFNDSAEIQMTIERIDDLHIEESAKEVNLNMWREAKYDPEPAAHRDHDYTRVSTCQTNRPYYQHRRGPVATQFGNCHNPKHSKVRLQSEPDVYCSNPFFRGKQSLDDATKWEDEVKGIINSLDSFNIGENHAVYKKARSSIVEKEMEEYSMAPPVDRPWHCKGNENHSSNHSAGCSKSHNGQHYLLFINHDTEEMMS